MALIKGRKLVDDPWQLLEVCGGGLPAVSATDKVIVPLAAWRIVREELISRGGSRGVWLAGSDDPSDLAHDLVHLELIAVHFATINDGRGYSTGRLLRERYGWRGELRAIGEVYRDQLFYLARCGFDAFAIRDAQAVDASLNAFDDFTEAYQAATDEPLPLFRRREISRNAGVP